VLLVEDDDSLRALTERILYRKGYTVLSAATAAEALRLAATPARIDLLLTDVVMPDSSGWALGEQIRAQAPDQKIIYMSGYSHEVLEQGLAAGSSFKLLQKPFTRVDLLKTIRRTLDGLA